MNEITIKEHKIDYLKLIDLALKREDWGKKYCLFKYGDLTVDVILEEVNFVDNTVKFRISVTNLTDTKHLSKIDGSWVCQKTVSFYLDNYSVNDFKRQVLKAARNVFNHIIENETLLLAKEKYIELKHFYWRENWDEVTEKLNISEEYNTIKQIKNELIRENMINSFEEEMLDLLNNEYDNAVEEYINDKNNKPEFYGFDSILNRIEEELDDEE